MNNDEREKLHDKMTALIRDISCINNPNRHMLMGLIYKYPNQTFKDLVIVTGLDENTLDYHLAVLHSRDFISRDKMRRYKITKLSVTVMKITGFLKAIESLS